MSAWLNMTAAEEVELRGEVYWSGDTPKIHLNIGSGFGLIMTDPAEVRRLSAELRRLAFGLELAQETGPTAAVAA